MAPPTELVVFAKPSGLRREATFLAPLEDQFRPIRTDELLQARVTLYERGR